jgi:hypothetical protein
MLAPILQDIGGTRRRDLTQRQARALFEGHAAVAGLRWWSTFEALWINVTWFDRPGRRLRLVSVRALTEGDPALVDAAGFRGL